MPFCLIPLLASLLVLVRPRHEDHRPAQGVDASAFGPACREGRCTQHLGEALRLPAAHRPRHQWSHLGWLRDAPLRAEGEGCKDTANPHPLQGAYLSPYCRLSRTPQNADVHVVRRHPQMRAVDDAQEASHGCDRYTQGPVTAEHSVKVCEECSTRGRGSACSVSLGQIGACSRPRWIRPAARAAGALKAAEHSSATRKRVAPQEACQQPSQLQRRGGPPADQEGEAQ